MHWENAATKICPDSSPKWSLWDKVLKAPEQGKVFGHYLSIRAASHFGFLNEKSLRNSVCQCLTGLKLIVFSLFRGYYHHIPGKKYNLHRTGILACPLPPPYAQFVHNFSGTCTCLKSGERSREAGWRWCTRKANSQHDSPIPAGGGEVDGKLGGCHLPLPGFLNLLIQ